MPGWKECDHCGEMIMIERSTWPESIYKLVTLPSYSGPVTGTQNDVIQMFCSQKCLIAYVAGT